MMSTPSRLAVAITTPSSSATLNRAAFFGQPQTSRPEARAASSSRKSATA
jgi:hypothetical protein